MKCPAMLWLSGRRGCDGCGKPLSKRAHRWCVGNCADLYWQNHRYTLARQACLARSVARFKRLSARRLVPTHWRCAKCGAHTKHPEVNHIQPALGRHSAESCIHHQENLEVLCHDCHVGETRRQRRAGELVAA